MTTLPSPSQPLPDLAGRVYAVTGATAGIGAATARALVAAGARVALGARRGERLERLAEELGAAATAVEMDVRAPADAQRLVDRALADHGHLDGLVANAGVGMYGGILDRSDDELAAMVDTNVNGTVWPIRAAVPALLDRGGDILIVASVAGLRGGDDEAVYAATKHAQVGLAGSLDRELRERGIRVTALCPGGVATEFAVGWGRTEDDPRFAGMLSADDVAHAAVTALGQPRHLRTVLWTLRSMSEPN